MAQSDGSGWSKNFISSDWQWISVLENSLTLACHVTTSSWSQFALENVAVTSISQHFVVMIDKQFCSSQADRSRKCKSVSCLKNKIAKAVEILPSRLKRT